jgi:hypothetical protein
MLKRLLVSLAAAVAILLAFGSTGALACDALRLDKSEATAGEPIQYTLSGCQTDDEWDLVVLFESPDSQDQTPEQRTLATGTAEDATITGEFALPDEIGSEDHDVMLRLNVLRNGLPVDDPPEIPVRYRVQAADGGGGGGTGPTGPTDTTSGDTTPTAVDTVPAPTPKRVTRAQQRKKNQAKAKTKQKSTAKKKSQSPAKRKANKRPRQPVVEFTPPRTAPRAGLPRAGAPASGSFQPSTLPKPSAGPPPGLGGPPAADGSPPDGGTPIVPITPPVTPSVSTGEDDNALGAPFWLVALLGLLTLAGLGGAQTRLLGFWGPLPPMNRDRRDARLLALQRAAQSGAASQKRIAELKQQTKDRTPVG